MKKLITLALLLATAPALADTELYADSCSSYNCFNVPSSSPEPVEFVEYAVSYKRLYVNVGGEIYASAYGTAPVTTVLSSINGVTTSDLTFTEVPVFGIGTGGELRASVTFQVVAHPCVQSGRAPVCPFTVTLLGGTLQ